MGSTLQKTRKQISKKRNGVLNALHEKSRDSLRLHKASVRDQRLDRLAAARSKKEQPIVDRVAFFQQALEDKGGEPLTLEVVQEFVQLFICQYEEEYTTLKKGRRPGRPSSAREDLLKIKVAALEAEYEQGFSVPDIMSAESVEILNGWEGSWSKLTTIPWIKVTENGQVRPGELPTKGIN